MENIISKWLNELGDFGYISTDDLWDIYAEQNFLACLFYSLFLKKIIYFKRVQFEFN